MTKRTEAVLLIVAGHAWLVAVNTFLTMLILEIIR